MLLVVSPLIRRARLGLDSDLVIAVGTSLASHSADAGRLYPNAKILHIDTHPIIYQQGRVAAHHHLCADAKIGVDAILNALGDIRGLLFGWP